MASTKDLKPSLEETTPLLIASEAGPQSQPNEEPFLHQTAVNAEDDDTPLPKWQIALLCYARVVEPIAFFSIFPFINEMVFVVGNIPEARIGFYSGLIESLFSTTQMLTMIFWGKAADKWGRKPIMVVSLIGICFSTAAFGFSTNIWQMILIRCIGGLFGGTIVTVRTMISENSTPKTQARAFSWFSFSSNIGIFVGPFIGGILSNPAKEYPKVFGNVQLFIDFPYALPTIITGLIGASAALTSALFIKETLTADRRVAHKATAPMTTRELVRAPGVTAALVIYGYVFLLAFAYTGVLTIFQYTDPALGGYGFSNFEIAVFVALAGISQALWTLLVFPPLQHRIGSNGVLRICAISWPVMFASAPFGNILLKRGWITAFWVTVPIATIMGAAVCMAFTAVQLVLNDVAPSHATLGTLNGISLAVASGLRAIAPALFASIFAIGVEGHIFGGQLAWVVIIALAVGLIVLLRWLPASADDKLKRRSDEEEEGGR